MSTEIIWQPQSGPQEAAILCEEDDLLFGGARGGGKTDYIIGDWLVHNEKYGGSTAGVIIRRTYPQLQEILKRSHEIYPKVGAVYKVAEKKWVFPNGGVLYLRHFEGNDAFEDMQGWNLTRLYVDEMGQFPSSEPLDKLKASLRNKEGVPVGFRATANPGGAGHHWIKSRYIDAAPAGYTLLKSGKGQYRVFIPSKVTDNKILLDNDPNYVERLKGIGSPELIRAWLDGDWSVIQGAYFPEFSYDKHVVRPEVLPKEWLRFKAMDWGSSAPFAVLWFAVSDGDYGIYPKNSLVVYREWYGGKDGKGWKLPISEVARGIKSMELRGETRYSVIDPAAFKEEGGPSIAEGLSKYGVNFRRADNARVAGWTEIRNRLVGTNDRPTLYIFDTCPNLIRTLPSMQHDDRRPEDLDTTGDDHMVDCLRYGIMSRPWISRPSSDDEKGKIKFMQNMTFSDLFPLKKKNNHPSDKRI